MDRITFHPSNANTYYVSSGEGGVLKPPMVAVHIPVLLTIYQL